MSENKEEKISIHPDIKSEDYEYLDNKTLRKLEAQKGDRAMDFVKKTEDGKTELHFYPDKPTQRRHKDRFIIKEPSKFYDPCAESSKMAIKCMESHDEDYKEVCSELFQAYRDCKKEWMTQRRKDLRSGGIW